MQSVDNVIKALITDFNKAFDDFQGLYLFGIFLDEQDHAGEDIELVAIFGGTSKEKREQIWQIIGKIETELDVCIDLYPYTEEEFKNDELYDEVMEEGIYYRN